MKFKESGADKEEVMVAPFAGAWIEMSAVFASFVYGVVAPFAGAWIEICFSASFRSALQSLPSRERGLKSPPSGGLLCFL